MRRVELNPMTLTEMGSGGGRRGVQATQEARRRNKEDGALITILSNLILLSISHQTVLSKHVKLFYKILSNGFSNTIQHFLASSGLPLSDLRVS